uniref:Uncharacterized protein n=1 Tax=Citrobacter pasteurii TaxID=1563222 RepID=A0A6C0NEB4_9ENTR|nr:Hypothetical protein [Citrobacter pasteurii]
MKDVPVVYAAVGATGKVTHMIQLTAPVSKKQGKMLSDKLEVK